ncbi:GroES (chaperonin 10)-like protein [Pseudocohnilembus persalinus]|uniref:GroES (Chaperonin 10)-like protein n=1 Tax=Pseudocohnilembus persalinus TaxID=266149 RepID=A0A0V0QS18_PSEPJ|nr:GroES (chaperonin 10)-like protein [Pseudocohnilembus persalinus]|eukprot:KRX05062.1 GroES (chaperonin 10)-like protein [Pseudocohnilembus persalinus]
MAQKIPKHIQGIIQQSKGGQYKFGQIEMPELKQGDLLIKVHAAPINPSDIGFIKGTYPSNDFPTILGKEGSGFVIAGYGEQEQKLIGKKVAFLPKASSRTGTYADYAISTINSSFILPDDVNLDQFSCVLINPQTVAYMFETVKENNVKAVVHDLGASQLGKQMTSYFQANGVDVINIVRRQDQLEDLKKNGAKYILNQNDEGFWDKLSELCQKLQVTIAFDAIGGEFTQNLINYLPNSSILYTYGSLAEKKDVILALLGTVINKFDAFGYQQKYKDRMKKKNKELIKQQMS